MSLFVFTIVILFCLSLSLFELSAESRKGMFLGMVVDRGIYCAFQSFPYVPIRALVLIVCRECFANVAFSLVVPLTNFYFTFFRCGAVPRHVAFIMDGNRKELTENNKTVLLHDVTKLLRYRFYMKASRHDKRSSNN